jgi:L-ascorbate metabolism protein UlaG (beta-lactamase superfamily)
MASTDLSDDNTPEPEASRQIDGHFENHASVQHEGVRKMLCHIWNTILKKQRSTRLTADMPVQRITHDALISAPNHSVYRLGHSTVLLKLRDKFWITDPVFAERASSAQWLGPKRIHEPPITLEELPPIEAVILSHDHSDHLDYRTILKLVGKAKYFLAPLGLGDILIKWGIDANKVRQLDWWQSTEVDGVQFIATPAQHFSGRGLFDRNSTLWASWVMIDGDTRIFFSCDSGYFDGFKRIGEQYGPFDLTIIETGAHSVEWSQVHMQPEQTLQAHIDLKGRWMLPIHNGTFNLSIHDWVVQFDRIRTLAWERSVSIATPQIGEAFNMMYPHKGNAWWLELDCEVD